MRPLRHSYTNRTLGDGATVVKCYQGPGALARFQRERAVLDVLQGRVPVPPVLGAEDGCLTSAASTGRSCLKRATATVSCAPNHPEARWELAWLYQLWSLA